MSDRESLRYGCNPHQIPARVYSKKDSLPITVLNGSPGYINLLDALNSWQLVKELKQSLDLPAATSFKHVSPAGAAVGIPLTEQLRQAYSVDRDLELSPLANAYARARGGDRVSSFGDWVALSDVVDVSTAKLLRSEMSDGIIARYEPEALNLLKQKRRGNYIIIEVDASYEPESIERREVYGISFEQQRNNVVPEIKHLRNIVTNNKKVIDTAIRDLLVGTIALKYTQSNSVCLVIDGQIIGIGAGQQSRIGCTRIAAEKARQWYLRQHAQVVNLPFHANLKRTERDNLIFEYLRSDSTILKDWQRYFTELPHRLTESEKLQWLTNLKGVSLASDGFIPFQDNIEVAYQSGVKYVAQPGGSLRDLEVIDACNERDLVMAFTGLRLFHH